MSSAVQNNNIEAKTRSQQAVIAFVERHPVPDNLPKAAFIKTNCQGCTISDIKKMFIFLIKR